MARSHLYRSGEAPPSDARATRAARSVCCNTPASDPKANLKKTLALAEKAGETRRADHLHAGALPLAVLLPERGSRVFFALAEPIPGPSTKAFQKLAKQHGVVIVASLFEKRAAGLYHNTAVIIDADGSLLGIYRKMHIPDDPLFYEKFYFTPGDTGFRAWQTKFGRIGVLICWDQWYPEAARLTALQGAEILFYPTAIGWHPSEKKSARCASARRVGNHPAFHAVANGCYVAAVNRIGHERPAGGDGIEFWGQSFVAGTSGEILAKASATRRRLVPVELGQVDDTRTTGRSCATAASMPTEAIWPTKRREASR
jgi:N-carbamoylputrescine amidase